MTLTFSVVIICRFKLIFCCLISLRTFNTYGKFRDILKTKMQHLISSCVIVLAVNFFLNRIFILLNIFGRCRLNCFYILQFLKHRIEWLVALFGFVAENYLGLSFVANCLGANFELYFLIVGSAGCRNLVLVGWFLWVVQSNNLINSLLSTLKIISRQSILYQLRLICIYSNVFRHSKVSFVICRGRLSFLLIYIFIWATSVTYFGTRIWAAGSSSTLTGGTD